MLGLPPADLAAQLRIRILKAGTPLHRIHHRRYGPCAFNDSGKGDARFSPLFRAETIVVPTLYVGLYFTCAAMETVFHDVPFSAGLKTVDKARFHDQVYSVLTCAEDLHLVDLTTIALRRIGIERKLLIDTHAAHYGRTRLWAQAIHESVTRAQGLYWVSRQHDEAAAVMLFADRMAESTLGILHNARSLVHDHHVYGETLHLADRLGVLIV